MKKSILITIGVLIILLVIGVWAYLFTFGKPANSSEIFARFGAGKDATVPVVLPEDTRVDTGDTSHSGASQALKQLTTRPVAGAGFVKGGIRYVEQGTGHIYTIDFATGVETLLSGTTIPGTRSAVFSPDSSYVAITMVNGQTNKTLTGQLKTGELFSGVALPDGAYNIAFASASGTLQFIVRGTYGSTGYSYNIARGASTKLFTIPLEDIHVLWGNPTYVYTTPTAKQTGYLYKVLKNELVYVTNGEPGLMAFMTGDGVVVTRNTDTVRSYAINSKGEKLAQPLIPYIPEKCTSGESFVYCAIPKNTLDTQTFPDDWYMGTISFDDVLRKVDIVNGSATLLVDFKSVSERAIDIAHIGADVDGQHIYFINKNDNTLWMFDTTL